MPLSADIDVRQLLYTTKYVFLQIFYFYKNNLFKYILVHTVEANFVVFFLYPNLSERKLMIRFQVLLCNPINRLRSERPPVGKTLLLLLYQNKFTTMR